MSFLDFNQFITETESDLIALRRYLHQNPELGHEEFKTAEFILNRLSLYGIETIYHYTPSSIVAMIGPSSGSALAFRADIDALPISEENAHAFISTTPGIMHACGHDVHTAILLGLSLYLKKIEHYLKRPIKLIFQHSEEINPSGAYQLIQGGVLENPCVEQIYGFHVWPNLEVGKIGIRYGSLMGGLDGVLVNMVSKDPPDDIGLLGGTDAIRLTGYFLSQIANLMHGRHLTDAQPVTLSFGMINGGKKPNFFAQSVTLEGTLRFLSIDDRNQAITKIFNVISEFQKKHNSEVIFDIKPNIRPTLVNSSECARVISLAVDSIPNVELVNIENPLHASEDFGWYLQHTQGAYFLLGSRSSLNSSNLLHSPFFDVDEKVISVGVQTLAQIVISEALA